MLLITRVTALTGCAFALVGCSRSVDSKLAGEWNCPSIEPEARVIYKPDHTYVAWIHNSSFRSDGSGTWRVEGDQLICRDDHEQNSELARLIYREKQGETKAQILKISQTELQVKAPDGITRTYERVK